MLVLQVRLGFGFLYQSVVSIKAARRANGLRDATAIGPLLVKADMLYALTNVRFWEQTGHLTNLWI